MKNFLSLLNCKKIVLGLLLGASVTEAMAQATPAPTFTITSIKRNARVGNPWTFTPINVNYAGFWQPDVSNEYEQIARVYKVVTNGEPKAKLEFKTKIRKQAPGPPVGAGATVYVFNGDITTQSLPDQWDVSDGTRVGSISNGSGTWADQTVEIPYDVCKNLGNVFSIMLMPEGWQLEINQGLYSHQLFDIDPAAESIVRYASTECAYTLPENKFLLHDGNGTPTLNTVPVMCLGASSWWINANYAPTPLCHSYSKGIPLSKNSTGGVVYWLSFTIYECNYDLTRTGNYKEWTRSLNRYVDHDWVDWFDLKQNWPADVGNWFQPDKTYELWIWKTSDPTNAARRYFHVWTDNGNVTNVPAYSVNLRQNNIVISNSTIKNNYSTTGTIDILANTSIRVLPGSGESRLLAGTQYRINPNVNCSNLQNPYRVANTEDEQQIEEVIDETIQAYPTPSSGLVTVKHPKTIKQLTVYNIVGASVSVKTNNNSSNETQIDLSDFAPGMYFLQIDDRERLKIIKQ